MKDNIIKILSTLFVIGGIIFFFASMLGTFLDMNEKLKNYILAIITTYHFIKWVSKDIRESKQEKETA